MHGKQKIPTSPSPKHINFSLNVHLNNARIVETKNIYNINNTKTVNHYHPLQSSKAMSKSIKDLTSGLQPSSARNSKLNMQSPQNVKRSATNSAAATTTAFTPLATNSSAKTLKAPIENAGSFTTSMLNNISHEISKKASTQPKFNAINIQYVFFIFFNLFG